MDISSRYLANIFVDIIALNMKKKDFEICETCDVSIPIRTACVGEVSDKLRKNVLCAFTVLSRN